MITSTFAFILFFGFIGLCVGSFLNVVIIRVPKKESISLPSSHCVTCKHPLKWYHNIPILSWIFLKGKCAFCKEKISIQYPIIEAISAFLFLSTAMKSDSIQEALILSTLFSMLLALSVIDLKYKAVPDSISIPALFVSLFVDDFFISLNDALLFAGGFSLLRIIISWIIKKEAMGEADIIIAGIIGAVLGVKLGLGAIYLSAVIALPIFLIVGKKGYELPFIPFLAIGLYTTWFFSPQVSQIMEMIYG
jgi:leader peptidase (prepilin peptidase)/N-methyltransferase